MHRANQAAIGEFALHHQHAFQRDAQAAHGSVDGHMAAIEQHPSPTLFRFHIREGQPARPLRLRLHGVNQTKAAKHPRAVRLPALASDGEQTGMKFSSIRPSTKSPGHLPSPWRISRSTASRLKSVGSLVPSSRTSRSGLAAKEVTEARKKPFVREGRGRTHRKGGYRTIAADCVGRFGNLFCALVDGREVALTRLGQQDPAAQLCSEAIRRVGSPGPESAASLLTV